MPKVVEITASLTPPNDWDRSLADSLAPSLELFHSVAWAERMRALTGFAPLYVTGLSNGVPMLRWLVLSGRQTVAVGPRARAASWIKAILGDARPARWYGQPASFVAELPETSSREILAAAAGVFRERGLRFAGGEWPLTAGEPPLGQHHKWATLRLDLRGPFAEIEKGFKPAARKEYRKANERGLRIRRLQTEAEMRDYVNFASICAKRYGKRGIDPADFLTCWKHLRTKPWVFETFVAELDQEPVAGLSVWGSQRMIGEMGSFQSERGFREKLGGPDFLKYEILRWASKQGIAAFDLAGVAPEPKDEKEANIRRFKEKWGGAYGEFLVLETLE